MRKLMLLTIFIMGCLHFTNAQNDTVLYIENFENGTLGDSNKVDICADKYQTVTIYAQNGCDRFSWNFDYGHAEPNENPLILPVIDERYVLYVGCDFVVEIDIRGRSESIIPNPSTHKVWKRRNKATLLQAVGSDSLVDPFAYHFEWSTGETTSSIEVNEGGTYTCEISDACGSAIRTFIVCDNVELYRATVDLETKLNKVTWQTIPEQAEYISEVKGERDGMGVGSAPYEQGYFLDNIGSENAARNYRLTAIATDGTECPIPSYRKGTLHVDYSPNASNPNKLNMAWTPPFIEEGAPISVSYFQICKYDPETNEVTVLDQLGANNTIGSYDVSLFDGGYAVVAAMFNEGKEYEELAFSNLTDFLVGIEENEGQKCRVYPNPAKDRFTVEGTGTMTVTNTLGQTVLTQKIDGKTTIELPQGMYFVKLGDATQKIVVE